jgi:nucleoside-diphosphate-sugar epimerase
MILRPAAIYGPGRGVHASIREGKYFLIGDGSNYISRIHVEDLAAHAHAALLADLEGAWPVADEEPCPAREIAAFCAGLLNLPMPPNLDNPPSDDTRRANRRVNGAAIRRLLGVSLRYPSYRLGIPACLEEEAIGVR